MTEIEHLVMPALRAAGRMTTYENQERMRKALTEAAHARAEANAEGGEVVAVLEFARKYPGNENEMPRVISCNWLPDGQYEVYTHPAPQPSGPVKPLEWVKPPLSETFSKAETILGDYKVWTHHEANGVWFWADGNGFGGEASSEEVAKTAVWEDYQPRILSALAHARAEAVGVKVKPFDAARLAEAESEITEYQRERSRWIDYTTDLQRIIEALCNRRALPEPVSTARHHYEMARSALAHPAVPEGMEADDYFSSLVAKARIAADKAMKKFPQPNYVALKIAEEAGEVVRGGVHYAEGRTDWSEVEGEVVQLLAMLIRFVTEGDHINGIFPPVTAAEKEGE